MQNPDLDDKLSCAAHHEAGHMTIAATQGLKLWSDGFMVDNCGDGLACYCKESEDCDSSRESLVLATFAGFKAQEEFSLLEVSQPLGHFAAFEGLRLR